MLFQLKSDTVAALVVLPRYPRYDCRNGYKIYSITVVLGSKYMGFPWGRDQAYGTTAVMGLGFFAYV